MPMLALRTTDDRDRPTRLPLRHATALILRLQRRRPRTAAGWTRLARSVFLEPAVWLGLLVCTLLSMIGVLFIRDTAVGLGLLIISPVMAPMVSAGLLASRGLLGLGGALPRYIRDAMLALGRCPACGYDLSRSPIQPDACATCAECGDAWDWHEIGDRASPGPEVIIIPTPPARRR